MTTGVRRSAAAGAFALLLVSGTPYGAAATAPEPVDLGGEPVTASTDPGAPTELAPGLWSVDLGSESQPLQFSYQRRLQGSAVHIGVIGAPAGPDGDGLELSATDAAADDPESDDCGSATATTDSSAPYGVLGAQVIVGDEDDSASPCTGADTIRIELSRYSSNNDEELPVALKVVEEAPASDPGTPLGEGEELDFRVPDPAAAQDAPAGSTAYDDAPTLDLGDGPTTIAASPAEGTELLWRVPLEWGDQLVARVDLPGLSPEEAERLGYPSTYVRVALVQPSRDVFAPTGEDPGYGFYGGTDASRMVTATWPLRYDNRFASDVLPTLPGDVWVAVTVNVAPEERAPIEVPVELTVEVTRTDASGPAYQDAVLAQGGGAGPDGYAAGTPFLVGDGRFAAVASGSPRVPKDTVDDDESWWGARHVGGVGLGVVSLACAVTGAVWLGRRRRAV